MAPKKKPTAAPEVIVVDHISKHFVVRKDNSLKERLVTLGKLGRQHREDFMALDDVSFSIRAGTTVGLIGHNGSGKSTLLKVVGGILDPSSGSVSRRGRIAALLELGAGFHPDLTGRENVFLNASILGLSTAETEASFDAILDFSGIGDFIDTQVKFYSSGMYVRLAFAVAVHTDPDILLVDEVLAVGDEAFQRKCLDKIREFQEEGRTIVIVTHALGQVVELCDRAILLNRGQVVFDGEPRDAVAQMRDILEERRVAGIVHIDEEFITARITEVTARAVGRDRGEHLVPGDDLEVTIDIDSPTLLRDWTCAIQIDGSLGQVLYGTTTKRMGIKLAPLQGRRRVRFALREVRFGPGKYFVNISLMNSAGQHLDDAPQSASFDTTDYGIAVGAIHAVPEFAELNE